MIRRTLAALFAVWLLGFAWFAVTLPGPSDVASTDAIIVLTGGKGRFQRGLEVLAAGRAKRMLVSGVDPVVRRREFEAVQGVPPHLSQCCIDLGKEATDTITNAEEAQVWIKRYQFKSVRLVTTDWHMRRAAFEMRRGLDASIYVVIDAVKGNPGLITLGVEYNKYLSRRVAVLFGA
jgi:uncharacterized SAM-binding protein YcdF (DUF218 family)